MIYLILKKKITKYVRVRSDWSEAQGFSYTTTASFNKNVSEDSSVANFTYVIVIRITEASCIDPEAMAMAFVFSFRFFLWLRGSKRRESQPHVAKNK